MKRKLAPLGVCLILALVAVLPSAAAAAGPGGATRQIPSGGTTNLTAASLGSGDIQQPELKPGATESEGAGSFNRPRPGFKNGKFPKKPLDAPTVPSSTVAGSNPELASASTG